MNELPKQYDPSASQERWAIYWDEKGFFHSEPNKKKKPFTIVIPPPNVTGALHLGHALNNTLQDILIRMKRMQGFETLWVPGVDHAGIATQAVVERRLFEDEKKTRHDIGREALVKRIWDWKDQYQARIISQLKSLGCSCDWERTRFTLDEMCAKAVRHFFFKLFKDSLVYRGKRLVNWDTHLQTAVSDDEVFYEQLDGNFWHLKYEVIDPQLGEPTNVIVATTRPETMLGDTAVAVHPDPDGYLAKIEEEIKEKMNAETNEKEKAALMDRFMDISSRRMSVLGSNLRKLAKMAKEGKKVILPLVNRAIPLILDEWAKPDLGSGCVKITPAHDPNDYEVGLRHNLPMINMMNKDGTINENGGPYAGMSMAEARNSIIADMSQAMLLVKTEARQIDIAHSDRSKTPIEPFLNDQWFVKMERLAQSAIDAVETDPDHEKSEKVRIFPHRYTKGYVDWLSEKRDWPIGRQLWWGHRIPIWYCKGAKESDLKKAFAKRKDIAWQYDKAGEQWWICSQSEDLASDAVPGFELVREEDVLDTWFSSALWPLSTLGWPDKTAELKYYYPTSTLITSRDIITLWVARMVLAGLYNLGDKPFSEVYITPKVLDKFGEGMSKSKGNGIDPLDVIEKFGADALRFAIAHLTTESQDIRLPVDFECPHCGESIEQTKVNRILPRIDCKKCGKAFKTQWAETPEDKTLPLGPVVGERFEVARNFCNKLWNAARFVMMNLEDAGTNGTDWSKPVPARSLLLEDRWILSRLAEVTEEATESLEYYHFSEAARLLYDFAWDEFCSFYVEMVKYRLNDPALRPLAQRVLAHILDSMLRLLHPFVPFVTEEIWQRLREYAPIRDLKTGKEAAESIVIAPWPKVDLKAMNPKIEAQFATFQELLRGIREIRASRNVPPKTVITFAVRCDAQTAALLKPMTPYFEKMAGAHATGWGMNARVPELFSNVALQGMELFVDLAALIDLDAEIAKKLAEIAKFEGLIKGKEAKLSGDFIHKAPEAVVHKERESLAELVKQLDATKIAHSQLTKIKAKHG